MSYQDRLARYEQEKRKLQQLTDEVFWAHADKRLEQMGLPFLPEDYDKIESQQR